MSEGIKVGQTPTLGMMRQEILDLARHDGEVLADISASLDRIEGCVDGVMTGLRGYDTRVDGLIHKLDRFGRDLRRVIRHAVREAFREERERKRR